jgi:hypothetical protein
MPSTSAGCSTQAQLGQVRWALPWERHCKALETCGLLVATLALISHYTASKLPSLRFGFHITKQKIPFSQEAVSMKGLGPSRLIKDSYVIPIQTFKRPYFRKQEQSISNRPLIFFLR